MARSLVGSWLIWEKQAALGWAEAVRGVIIHCPMQRMPNRNPEWAALRPRSRHPPHWQILGATAHCGGKTESVTFQYKLKKEEPTFVSADPSMCPKQVFSDVSVIWVTGSDIPLFTFCFLPEHGAISEFTWFHTWYIYYCIHVHTILMWISFESLIYLKPTNKLKSLKHSKTSMSLQNRHKQLFFFLFSFFFSLTSEIKEQDQRTLC